jgi:hypothetical protein
MERIAVAQPVGARQYIAARACDLHHRAITTVGMSEDVCFIASNGLTFGELACAFVPFVRQAVYEADNEKCSPC